jgi:hypothetical protein
VDDQPAPWLVRVRNGELNGPVQRCTAAVAVALLAALHWTVDVIRQRRERRG